MGSQQLSTSELHQENGWEMEGDAGQGQEGGGEGEERQ